MYYYGNNSGCGYGNTYMSGYSYPMYGYGNGTSAATVLVLFILLVIIIGSRAFGPGNFN